MPLAGAALLLAAGIYTGLALSAAEGRRVRELAAFCLLFDRVESGVEHLRLPLLRLFAEFSDETLDACGFSARLRALASDGTCRDPLGTAVRQAMEEGMLSLSSGDAELLCAFSSALGRRESAEEEKRCAYYHALWTRRTEDARTALGTQQKLSRVLPCSLALLLILLLL